MQVNTPKKNLYVATSSYYLKYKGSNFLDLENTATIATSQLWVHQL